METLFGVVPMKGLAIGLALAVSITVAAVVATGFRNRIFVKLALRSIPRRPAQSALIVIGLMLSTMIIAASLGVGDTVAHSIRAFVVVDGLGHTDETLRSPTPSFLGDSYLADTTPVEVRAALAGDPRVDGVLPLIREVLPVTNPRTSRTEARADVRGYGLDSLDGFGDLKTIDGRRVAVTDLLPGEIYLNVDAREPLDARAGDEVLIATADGRQPFRVRDVLRRGGLAGSDPRVLMRLADLQRILGREGQINRIDISNAGGVMDGLRLSDQVTEDLRLKFTDEAVSERLFELLRGDEIAGVIESRIGSADLPSGVRDNLRDLARELRRPARSDRFTALMADQETSAALLAALDNDGRHGLAIRAIPLILDLPTLRVTPIKDNLVDLAETFGSIFTGFFIIFGSFSIIVGLLLIFLVFVLLAAAREQEMGLARAIGTKRGHLVRLFTFEGTAYALLAGIVGTALGVVAAFALVAVLNTAVSEEEGAFMIRANIQLRSVVAAFSAGVMLTLLTVMVSAYRVSRLTIVTAIRGLPEQLARTEAPPLRCRASAFGWALASPVRILYEEMMARGWGDGRTHRRVVAYALLYAIVTVVIVSAATRAGGGRAFVLNSSLGIIWLWWLLKPVIARPLVFATAGGLGGLGTAAVAPGRGEWGEPRTFWWLLAYLVFLPLIWLKRVIVEAFRLVGPYNHTGVLALGFGALVAAWGISLGQTAIWSSGASLFLIGVGQLSGLTLSRLGLGKAASSRVANTVSAALVLIFWSLPFDSFQWLTGDLDASIEMFVLSGLWMVGSAVWVVMHNADTLTWLADRAIGAVGSLKPVIRIAIAYPMAARFRTGLTIAMFSMVIFTLIVFAILNNIGNVFDEEPDRVTGGFDIRATIDRDLPITDFNAVLRRSGELSPGDFQVVARTGAIPGEARQEGAEEGSFKPLTIRALDRQYLDSTLITFTHRDPAYGTTDREIWDALRRDPSLAVMNAQPIFQDRGGFGGFQPEQFEVEGISTASPKDIQAIKVMVRAPGGRGNEVTRTVIAFMDGLANSLDDDSEGIGDTSRGGTQISTIFGSRQLLDDISPVPVPYTIYQFRLADPSRADEITRKLETVFLDHGMRADSARELIDRNQEQGNVFNLLFQGFMGLGLLVGVASLGVISFRAVVERRQAIGMMRAIGYKGWMIQTGFLLESSLIALLGITIGIGLGSLISWNIVNDIGQDIDGLKFNIPWLNVLAIVGIAWAFAMVTSYWPARQASRIYPSEALRYE